MMLNPSKMMSKNDCENVHKRPVKNAVMRPLGPTRRPPLDEIGNKPYGLENLTKPQSKPNLQEKPKVNISKAQIKLPQKKPSAITAPPKTSSALTNESRNISKQVVHSGEKEIISFSTKHLIDIIDVDAPDTNNQFAVVEYLQDIYSYLRSLENEYSVQKNYLVTHRSTPRMRTVLVNWMVDVHTNFKFFLETLHLSIGLLDRYLQLHKETGRATLQLVGVACLLIASKYEEMYVPDITDFVYICDNTFSKHQIFKMERDILRKLNFNVGHPLSLHFLRRCSKIAQAESDHHNLSKYLLEICLVEYQLCHIKPSLQAAAACYLSITVLNEVANHSAAWSKTMAYYTSYQFSDIQAVVNMLAYFVVNMRFSKHQAVREKYASSRFGKISLHKNLDKPAIQKLADKALVLKK